MSGRIPTAGSGETASGAKALLVKGTLKAHFARVIALVQGSAISRAEGGHLISGLFDLEASPFDARAGELSRYLETIFQQRFGDSAAWLRADQAESETLGTAFLIATRGRILDLARTHLRFAATAVELANAHQDTIIRSPASHANGTATTFGHSILTYVYPAFRDLERLQHCYRSFNSSPCGAGRNATGTRLPVDLELLRTLLGFDECRSHSNDALWQADGPIELMAAIVALLVNLNRLADDLRSLADAGDSSNAAWIRSLTSELLSKVPEMASLGKEHDGNAEDLVIVTEELCAAFEGAIRAVDLVTALAKRCAENALISNKPAFSSATQSDLVEVFVTRGGVDQATAERMAREIDRLVARGEIEIQTLTPEGVDIIALQITGRPLNLSVADLQSAIEPERLIIARRGPGGVSPVRMVEMITECRARLVRENLWVSTAGQRLAKSDALLQTEAREIARG